MPHSRKVSHGTTCKMSRRTFLHGSLLVGAVAACPSLLGGCATFGSSSKLMPDPADATLQQKIAQMLILGFRATELNGYEPVVRDVRDLGIGGVILFDWDDILITYQRDIISPKQLARLTESLRSYSGTPLLIAIDQEGGRVNRLKESYGFPPTVSVQSLGTANDLARTRSSAESIAGTLKKAGINVNLAPVLDLNVNPENPVIGKLERSFSADPAIVIAHSREFISAHERNGVMTCLKHFPGHGSSATDSHKGFTDVTDTWTEKELEPYRAFIREGNCKMVMTAHIFNEKLDPLYPATLSHATITGLLRNKLGFKGVVVSDDMQMGAITQHFNFETALEKTILAGVDMLVICNESAFDSDVAPKTIELVTQLVNRGVISEERINESYQRIAALKGQMTGYR